jgi:hypothetical protein
MRAPGYAAGRARRALRAAGAFAGKMSPDRGATGVSPAVKGIEADITCSHSANCAWQSANHATQPWRQKSSGVRGMSISSFNGLHR